MFNRLWELIVGTNSSSATEDAKARHAAFLSYFLNDTKPCDIYEVLYLKRNVCPAPPILVAEVLTNTTEVPIIPAPTPLPDIRRYALFISFFIFGTFLTYIIKRCLRIPHSRVQFTKKITKKKNVNSSATTTTVLVVGANKTGKKSIISAFNKMYPNSKTWNFITQDFSQRRIPVSPVPDLIWLVVNYQASIHENEFKILQYVNKIPVILVINKVDLLQEINMKDDNIIRNFDKRMPNCLEKYERLMNVRERLLQFDRQIVILSLRQEEDSDRELGMDNLIDTTNESLLNKNLENNSQHLFDYDAVKHELKEIRNNAGMNHSSIRVLLIGYTCTGKSSLINCFAGSNIASVSFDGLPVTQNIEEYCLSDLNLILIDSMGLEKKQDNTKKLEKLKQCYQSDFIWFLVNYQSSIEQDELNLINELFPLIPTIIVVNFMDILQTFDHDIDFETDTQQNNQQYQVEKQRLLQFKQSQTNVRRIIAISLRSEEQDDRPRGLKLLYEETIKNFLKDTYI